MFKNRNTNSEKAFTYEKKLIIGKSLFSKVPSSNSLRSPTARCFRKANAFSDFRFEDKINPSSAGKIEKLNF